MKIILDAVYEGVNNSAPEARKIVAPAEGRGFQSGVSQPRRGVRLSEEILRPYGPQALCSSDPPAWRAGLCSYGPLGLLIHTVLLIICVLLPHLAAAQGLTGTLIGTVRDEQEAAV